MEEIIRGLRVRQCYVICREHFIDRLNNLVQLFYVFILNFIVG